MGEVGEKEGMQKFYNQEVKKLQEQLDYERNWRMHNERMNAQLRHQMEQRKYNLFDAEQHFNMKKNNGQLDLQNLEEVRVHGLEEFVDWFRTCKIVKVSEQEVYIYSQEKNKICIIDKGEFVDSLFSLPEKDLPINEPESLMIPQRDPHPGSENGAENNNYGQL